jgi:hypothetical protein
MGKYDERGENLELSDFEKLKPGFFKSLWRKFNG